MNQKVELTIEEMNAEMQAMMEGQVSNIEALPEFVNPPPGNYIFNVEKFELDEGDDGKQFISVLLALQSVVDTRNPDHLEEALAIPVGSLVSQRYYGSFGIRKMVTEWAMAITNLVGEHGTIPQFMDAIVGCEVGVSTSLRVDKDDPDRVFVGLRKVVMAAG